jgi:hypothetical protein
MANFYNLAVVASEAERNALPAIDGMIVSIPNQATFVFYQGSYRPFDISGQSKYATVTATLVNGEVVVPTSTITSTGRITLTYDTVIGVPGALYAAGADIVPLTSFTIKSTSLGDNSVVTATYNTTN